VLKEHFEILKAIDGKVQVLMEAVQALNQKLDNKLHHSQTPDKALTETIREKGWQDWLNKSRESIEEYAHFVEKHGCFGDKLRCF
jgi:post-segregation antitoxin (ccd killing protein)